MDIHTTIRNINRVITKGRLLKMSRNTLWNNEEFKAWLKSNGKDPAAVLSFASDYHLRNLGIEFYEQKSRKDLDLQILNKPVLPESMTIEELSKFPENSYAVYVDDRPACGVGRLENPTYYVIQVHHTAKLYRKGTGICSLGFNGGSFSGPIIDSFRAFKKEDTQIYLDKAIAKAADLNQNFIKEHNRVMAIKNAAEKRQAENLAAKNKGQTLLFAQC